MIASELLYDLAKDRRRALLAAAAADRTNRPVVTRAPWRQAVGARLIRAGLALVA
ncbi:MAG TPA: hypothetical protein VGT61_16210 [Thermomicrobiales bacterium]|jgi:hypothetical protein|nr:hypothetical protein [Thermomicrobiales bacterium]